METLYIDRFLSYMSITYNLPRSVEDMADIKARQGDNSTTDPLPFHVLHVCPMDQAPEDPVEGDVGQAGG